MRGGTWDFESPFPTLLIDGLISHLYVTPRMSHERLNGGYLGRDVAVRSLVELSCSTPLYFRLSRQIYDGPFPPIRPGCNAAITLEDHSQKLWIQLTNSTTSLCDRGHRLHRLHRHISPLSTTSLRQHPMTIRKHGFTEPLTARLMPV